MNSIHHIIFLELIVGKILIYFYSFRSIGSDISVGQHLLDQKTVLGPFEIALLRSVGCENVQVYK